MSGEIPSGSERRRLLYRRQLEGVIFRGLNSSPVCLDRDGIEPTPSYAQPETGVEDIEDGYQVTLDPETGALSTQEIRNGQIIEPEEE